MRKFLLTIAGGLVTAAMLAVETPEIFPGMSFKGFSPNGQWAVTDDGSHAPMTIWNLNTGDQVSYSEKYAGGNGNFISDNGVVVGYVFQSEIAAYWENGQWSQLPILEGTISSYAEGITPDGNMIVGSVSPTGYEGNFEGTMLVPCIWERGTDGTFGDPILLPHPTLDYTGRPGQYITAISVSADGNTIAGQLSDFQGYGSQPLIYTRDASGTWSCKELIKYAYSPEGFELPEYPGDGPNAVDYLSPADREAYEAAVRLWELTGNNDWSIYPNAQGYLTPAQEEQYLEDVAQFQVKYVAYEAALHELSSQVPLFFFNNIFLTPDGTKVGSTEGSGKVFRDEVTGTNYVEYVPFLIDVATDTYQQFPPVDGVNIMLSGITEEGSLLGQYMDINYRIFNGYILPYGKKQFISFYDFVEGVNPTLAEWMEENMTHEYTQYDPATDEYSTASAFATGIPVSTPDLTLVGFGQYVFWDEAETTYGYLISLPPMAGVDSITAAEGGIAIYSLGNGSLGLKGGVKQLSIYTPGGAKVFETQNPGAVVATGLANGIYVVRAVDQNGEVKTQKILL